MRFSHSICGLALAACAAPVATASGDETKPSIVLIMSDDQDRRLGSTDFQSVLHRDIYSQGVEFVNHFATTAQCCPSRASFLKGQAAHNTNVTNVHATGLTLVLDVGKFLNGYNVVRANITPKGWDHVDALLDPYTTYYNVPVMSQNGQRPVYYQGFHSTDAIRTRALERLQSLVTAKQPYYLQIAPYAPHVQNNVHHTIPLARHMELFPEARAPRLPNYNPDDEHQAGKGGWPRTLLRMNETSQATSDMAFRYQAQALQGLDEIIEDVVAMLDASGALDNTYVIYTSDNGYHIGQHRIPCGKALFYGEDIKLPFAVRGPGVPKNVTSKIPGVHLDLVPTFLDIAGSSSGVGSGDGNSKETLNVEFWGTSTIEAPNGKLYDTAVDPYELVNLAGRPEHEAVLNRLNALLLVTKSCAEGTCRDPWSVFASSTTNTTIAGGDKLTTMKQAMDPKYDAFFASFPRVHFASCMQYQDIANEAPFYPESAGTEKGLGLASRRPTNNFVTTTAGVAIADANFYAKFKAYES
ncbi:MFS transporter [Apiospora arundinis]